MQVAIVAYLQLDEAVCRHPLPPLLIFDAAVHSLTTALASCRETTSLLIANLHLVCSQKHSRSTLQKTEQFHVRHIVLKMPSKHRLELTESHPHKPFEIFL